MEKMPRIQSTISRNRLFRGFTLVEMALVVAIVGLLLTGAIFTLSAQNQASRQRETEKQLLDIQEALLGFAIANGRLPRPALSATNGAERGACATDAECTGLLPWQTLGVGISDPFGKRYRYSVTPAYAGDTSGVTVISLDVTANRTVQTRDSTGALVYVVGSASCSAAAQCAPAVILSHGPLQYGFSSANGTPVGNSSATNVDENTNATSNTIYIQRPPSDNTGVNGGEFDDVVVWLPLPTLGNRLAQAGKL